MNTYLANTLSKLGIDESFGGKLTIYGFFGIHIEGHKGLLDYTDTSIVFRMKNKKISINGENLSISEISSDEIFVKGKILSLGAENIGKN